MNCVASMALHACNVSPSRPWDHCRSVRSSSHRCVSDQTVPWRLGARDAGFRESLPDDVIDDDDQHTVAEAQTKVFYRS